MQIREGKRPGPRRILLHAPGGIGKSTWASMAPRPIFQDVENGLNDIDCKSLPRCHVYEDIVSQIEWLYGAQHDYKTYVGDTADWMERLIHRRVAQRKNVSDIAEIGYGKGYDFALIEWQEIIDGLEALQNDRGMNVILTCHTDIEKFNNPASDSYHRYEPYLHRIASHFVRDWCTEILFANYKVYTVQQDAGFNRKETKAIGSGERVLYTTERPSHVAKNRLNLPDEMPFDWQAFAEYLPPAAL